MIIDVQMSPLKLLLDNDIANKLFICYYINKGGLLYTFIYMFLNNAIQRMIKHIIIVTRGANIRYRKPGQLRSPGQFRSIWTILAVFEQCIDNKDFDHKGSGT